MQICLNNQGLLESSITGRYDNLTRKAVKRFLEVSASPVKFVANPEKALKLCENKQSFSGSVNAGNIYINPNLATLDNGTFSQADISSGRAGDIQINTNLLRIHNDAHLKVRNRYMKGSYVGNLTIRANEEITFDATSTIIDIIGKNNNNIFDNSNEFIIKGSGSLPIRPTENINLGNGNGGNIIINSSDLKLLRARANIRSIGEAGNININSNSIPLVAKNPSTVNNIGTIQQDSRYIVVVPITNSNTLFEVRKLVPTAFAAKSTSGNYVNAGTYHERSLADSLAKLLQTRGFDAKVKTF